MKKISISLLIIFLFTAYALLHNKVSTSDDPIALPLKNTLNNTDQTVNDTPSSSSSSAPNPTQTDQTPSPTQNISNTLKDGNFTGQVTDAYYGNIQVRAIINNGKLTDIQFLQYPNDRRESIEINSQALPMLRQEAIAAQSAKVDIVTGATDSSYAFIQSLSSALQNAKS